MPSVSNSISTLSSVSWTDLNGSGLTSTQETAQIALVNNISNVHDELRDNLSGLNLTGTYSIAELASGSSLVSSFNTQQEAWNAAYADLSYRVTNGININGAQASFIDPSSPTGVSWVSFRLSGYGGNSSGISVSVGNNVFLQSTSQTPPSQAYPMPDHWNTYASPVISSNNSLLALAITQINASGGRQITASDRFTPQEWLGLLNRLEGQSYLEASKLKTANGGGIKTHGGVWYANGQELSYLDISFAVRVNQLHVVNTSITDYLEQVQENNKKIKLANKIAAIVAADAPSDSDGSVNPHTLGVKIINALIESGYMEGITPSNFGSGTGWDSLESVKVGLYNNNAGIYTENGVVKWIVERNWNTNTASWETYNANADGTIPDNIGDANTKIISSFVLPDVLEEIMPSSFDSLFSSWSNGTTEYFNLIYGSLSQTECTAITTELKSFTSGVDSDNQLLQTQLTQYNDKRTEVLDDLSSLVKGNSAALNDMARNLSAI